MVHFVGASSEAPDLITLRGKRLLDEADVNRAVKAIHAKFFDEI